MVRPSVAADVEPWLDVLAAVAAEGRWIGTEAPIDRDLRRQRFLHQLQSDDEQAASFVAVADGRIVGSLGAALHAGSADLGMFVASDSRASGVGSALMQACVDWAKSVGAHKVTLQVWPHNFAARALYAKFGFVTEGRLRRAYRRRSGQLWDALTMGLVLDTSSLGGEDSGGPGSGRGGMDRPHLPIPPAGLRRQGLLLRPGRLSDAPAIVAALDDPEMQKWLDFLPTPYTTDDAGSFLCVARQGWTEGTAGHFVVLRQDTLVGSIRLRLDAAEPGRGEVGYWVTRTAQGRGVATAALQALVDWAFGDLGLRRIELHAAAENVAARTVAERAGFQLEGTKRAWLLVRGHPTDFVLYARVADAK